MFKFILYKNESYKFFMFYIKRELFKSYFGEFFRETFKRVI